MPTTLRKKLTKRPFNLRLDPEQRADLDAAAELESGRRRAVVEGATLARELLMPRIHELLRSHGREPRSTPREPEPHVAKALAKAALST